MNLDEICIINEVPQCALTQKNLGEIAPGVPSKGAKICFVFFSVKQPIWPWPFGQLSCTDFDHF